MVRAENQEEAQWTFLCSISEAPTPWSKVVIAGVDLGISRSHGVSRQLTPPGPVFFLSIPGPLV
jgi:hypothetical protein